MESVCRQRKKTTDQADGFESGVDRHLTTYSVPPIVTQDSKIGNHLKPGSPPKWTINWYGDV